MKKILYKLATDQYRAFPWGIAKFALFLLSLIYCLIIKFLNFSRQIGAACFVGCKVIGIGNLTLGGTGKTSLVEYAAAYLRSQGRRVVIVSRGYKREFTNRQSPAASYQTMGDEPFMLARKLEDIPVIVDSNRARGIKRAVEEYHAHTVILDDAFQQWGIKKDLEIVTVDAHQGFGNKRVIPRGVLREPLSGLERADIFVLTKTNIYPDTADIKKVLHKFNPFAQVFEAAHEPLGFFRLDSPEQLIDARSLSGRAAALFCGIGDPDSFEKLVMSLGIKIGLSFYFDDHHNYADEDLENIFKAAKEKNIDTIITTEKDAARLSAHQLIGSSAHQLIVLRIGLKIIKDEEGFNLRLRRVYSA